MTLAELDSRLSNMTDDDLRRHAMDGYQEYFKKFHEERERAEKAEAKLKVSEEARQNAVLCMMEANRLALEDQARAEKAEAERDELKKLSSHGNGEISLGWMDAHRKAMDQLEKAETERDIMTTVAIQSMAQ